ncbi:MAG: hypothetical protein AB7O88_04975 [Reyranellaceae bacterium]
MHIDDPKPTEPPSDDAGDASPSRESFDVREFETMRDDEADAEWLRRPEAWHMH